MTTTAIPMPAGLAGQPDTSDHRPLCAGGCGRRTAASAAEWRRDRWADR